jgi:hypothetical protein
LFYVFFCLINVIAFVLQASVIISFYDAKKNSPWYTEFIEVFFFQKSSALVSLRLQYGRDIYPSEVAKFQPALHKQDKIKTNSEKAFRGGVEIMI